MVYLNQHFHSDGGSVNELEKINITLSESLSRFKAAVIISVEKRRRYLKWLFITFEQNPCINDADAPGMDNDGI